MILRLLRDHAPIQNQKGNTTSLLKQTYDQDQRGDHSIILDIPAAEQSAYLAKPNYGASMAHARQNALSGIPNGTAEKIAVE